MSRLTLPQTTPGVVSEHVLPGTDVVIERLPKVSLHDHLDGGVRPATIMDIATRDGITVPASSVDELAEWFRVSADSGSLVTYLETFAVTLSVMQTADNLQRIAREFVLDLAADGVIYGEVRWAPELHVEAGLTLDEAVRAVQSGIDSGIAEAQAGGQRIRIGQLLCAMRQNNRGLEIAQLAVAHRDSGVVGFDIAGPEAGFPASALSDAFDYLDRQWMPRTIHAGEADGIDSISSALIDGRALRLGHGVRIMEAIHHADDRDPHAVRLDPIAEWVLDRKIALETSPTSNLQTGAFAAQGLAMSDHPFDVLYRLGFTVTVNTDNRLMSGTTLSRELAVLAEVFDYTLDDVLEFQLNAAQSAFLPEADREALIAHILDEFDRA